jgi:predicted ABC-type ATPase
MEHPVVTDISRLIREADDDRGLPVGTKTKRQTGVWKKIKYGVWKLIKPAGGQAAGPASPTPPPPKAATPAAPSHKPHVQPAAHKPTLFQPSKPSKPSEPWPPPKKGWGGGSSFSWGGMSWPKKHDFPYPGSLAKPSASIDWFAEPPKPRTPQTSSELHRAKGGWTPEREELHKKILGHFLDKVPSVPKDKKPIVIMTMGIPASGKSQLVRGVKTDQFVKVDADAIKEMIPEYQDKVKKGDRNAANYVHDESGTLASRLRDMAREQRKNVVYDGTGKYVGSYLHRIEQFQKDGYHVQVLMPHLSAETAIERADQRGKEGGRWVSSDIIRSNAHAVPYNFEELARAADSAMLFDTEGDKPRLVWAKHRKGETNYDDKFMKGFWDRYGAKKKPAKAVVSSRETVQQLRSVLREGEPVIDPKKLAISLVRDFQREPEAEPEAEPETKPNFDRSQGIIVPEPKDD